MKAKILRLFQQTDSTQIQTCQLRTIAALQHHYLQHNQAFFSISSASWQLEWNNYRTNISHLAGKLAWTEWKSPLSCHWPNTELHRLIWIEGRWCSIASLVRRTSMERIRAVRDDGGSFHGCKCFCNDPPHPPTASLFRSPSLHHFHTSLTVRRCRSNDLQSYLWKQTNKKKEQQIKWEKKDKRKFLVF